MFKITSKRISYSLDTNVHSFFLRRRLACFILGFVPHNKLFSSKKVSIWMCPLKTLKTILENSYLTETISCLHFRCEKITKVLKVPPTVTEVDFLKFLIRILILYTSNTSFLLNKKASFKSSSSKSCYYYLKQRHAFEGCFKLQYIFNLFFSLERWLG